MSCTRSTPQVAILLGALSLAAALHGGCSAPPSRTPPRSVGLLQSVREALVRVNPRVRQVRVLEVLPNPAVDSEQEYAVLTTGIAPNPGPDIDFSNELFGVFVVDSSLTSVLRVLEVFPTARWGDYDVRFERTRVDTLEVVGSGATYGDGTVRRVYNWGPNPGPHPLLRKYTAAGDTAIMAE